MSFDNSPSNAAAVGVQLPLAVNGTLDIFKIVLETHDDG
jgi:hypothetical protein